MMASTGSAWVKKYPVYQIDFACVAAGKRVASTKRRIRWRFGFPNRAALDDGQTGTDCRGEEHDVTIVWSVTSGKRQITMDGKEINMSVSRSSVLDFSWTTRGNHVLKILAYVSPPLSPVPGFRQYDLFIDGQSFFTMPKVFELGIKGTGRSPGGYGSPMSIGGGGGGYSSPRNQEEEDLKRAIEESLKESQAHLTKARDDRSAYTQPPAETADLLDFAGGANGPPPGDAQSAYTAPPAYGSPAPSYNQTPSSYQPAPYQSPPGLQQANPIGSPDPSMSSAVVPSHGPPGSYYGTPSTPQYASPAPVPPAPAPTPNYGYPTPSPAAPTRDIYGAPNPGSSDVFGLQSPQYDDPFAPKPPPPPNRNDITSAILGAYSPSTPSGQAAQPNQFASPQMNGAPQQNTPNQQTPQQNGAPKQTMLALTDTSEPQDQPKDDVDAAMKKLINFDRIDEPAVDLRLTMMRKEEAKKAPKGKSQPLPPVASGQIRPNAPLSEISKVKPTTPKVEEGKVMRAPPPNAYNGQYSGALVVHGQGPPPLHQASGFGVGAMLPNGGFAQQQSPPPMGYQTQYSR